MKNKKIHTGIIAILAVVLVITGAVMIPRIRQEGGEGKDSRTENQVAGEAEEKDGIFRSLGEPDQQTAAIYAELYETPREEVAALYVQTKDWEKTGETLEKQFFTIPENTEIPDGGRRLQPGGHGLQLGNESSQLCSQWNDYFGY